MIIVDPIHIVKLYAKVHVRFKSCHGKIATKIKNGRISWDRFAPGLGLI